MNHQNRRDRAYIEYTAVIDTSTRLRHVKPYWLRVTGCENIRDPIFNVPGGGGPGSRYVKSAAWRAPLSGRIVAANSHVHGGAKACNWNSWPATAERCSSPAPVGDFRVTPTTECCRCCTSPVRSARTRVQTGAGVEIARGEPFRVSAVYDNQRLHTRVMGIMHIYVAPSTSGHLRNEPTCSPAPGRFPCLSCERARHRRNARGHCPAHRPRREWERGPSGGRRARRHASTATVLSGCGFGTRRSVHPQPVDPARRQCALGLT